MIRIPFDPMDLAPDVRATWDESVLAAEAAAMAVRQAHAAGQPLRFRQRVWAHVRDWMLEHLFAGKCAYCETPIRVAFSGDAEHWRPKQAVTELDGADEVPVRDAAGNLHPGYYWLAYDWRNLLPACKECNVGSAGGRGKGTLFPIAGRRVFDPQTHDVEELNRIEQPLLLHPLYDDPEQHLDFDEYGQPIAKGGSARGDESIRVFNLERPWLNRRRAQLHDDLRKKVKQTMAAQLNGGPNAVDELRELMTPDREYSLAAASYIRKWYAHVRSEEFAQSP